MRETKVPGMTAGLACAAGWLGFPLPGNCRGDVWSPEMHPYPGREAKNAPLGNKLGGGLEGGPRTTPLFYIKS